MQGIRNSKTQPAVCLFPDINQFLLWKASFPASPCIMTFGKQNSEPMSVMIIHIVVSLLIACGFLAAFIWAIRTNQYDDDYSPSVRMLFDEHKPKNQNPQ